MKKYLSCVIVLFSFCLLLKGQSISDSQLFDAIDLEYDGLQEVRNSVQNKDYRRAKKEFVLYLKRRTKPVWFVNWNIDESEKRKTRVNLEEADRNANNELVSRGIWHKYGKKVNWLDNPPENKGNNNEWIWQLNRHRAWSVLGSAYWYTGNEKYAKAFVQQLNSWLEQCVVPEKANNGIGSPWRTLEAGYRMMRCWPDVFSYFLSSPEFDDESIVRMVKSFYEHGRYLRSNYSNSNNWLSIEMNGLYAVGVFFPEFRDASEWRAFSAQKLYEEEINQFYPDGAQKELATGYHGNSLSSIVSLYRMATMNDYQLPKDYVLRLEQAYEYFQRLKMPNGRMPAINDSGWGDSLSPLVSASDLFPSRKDFLYSATNGSHGVTPSYLSTWMPWAGWYIMRSGWDEDSFYSFFEVGPSGIAHYHEDKLSFILYAYGSLLITECGTYEYDNSQWRQYAISARGHNVARVDGKDQNRKAHLEDIGVSISLKPLSNRFVKRRDYELGVGEYSEGYGPDIDKTVTHRRTFKYIKNKYWLITDEFIPSDNKIHQYDIWFHMNTNKYCLDRDNNVVYSADEGTANIAIIRLGDNRDVEVITGQKQPEVQGWVSEITKDGNYTCRPVATPMFHLQGSGVVKETFVFVPFPKNKIDRIEKVERVTSRKYRICFDSSYSITVKV